MAKRVRIRSFDDVRDYVEDLEEWREEVDEQLAELADRGGEEDENGMPKWLSHPLIQPHASKWMAKLSEPGMMDKILARLTGEGES